MMKMADWMTRYVTVKRDNKDLQATLNKLKEIRERYQHISLDDRRAILLIKPTCLPMNLALCSN